MGLTLRLVCVPFVECVSLSAARCGQTGSGPTTGLRAAGAGQLGAGLAVVPVEEEQGEGAHHQEEEHPHAEARIVLDGLGTDRGISGPGLPDRTPPPHP